MTGLELLRDELRKRGVPDASINSKYVAAVLEVVSESKDTYLKLREVEREIEKGEQEIRNNKGNIARWKKEAEMYNAKCFQAQQEYEHACRKEWIDAPEYIEKFCKSLEECETPEGRDTMRIAQMFINTVTVDTKYDNTAFIIGLAAILQNSETSAIDELRKINKRIPNPNNRKNWIRCY